jgi:hypothetical protein
VIHLELLYCITFLLVVERYGAKKHHFSKTIIFVFLILQEYFFLCSTVPTFQCSMLYHFFFIFYRSTIAPTVPIFYIYILFFSLSLYKKKKKNIYIWVIDIIYIKRTKKNKKNYKNNFINV